MLGHTSGGERGEGVGGDGRGCCVMSGMLGAGKKRNCRPKGSKRCGRGKDANCYNCTYMYKKGSFDKFPCTFLCDEPRWSKENKFRVDGDQQDVAEKAARPTVAKAGFSAGRVAKELGSPEDIRALRSDDNKKREATKVPPPPPPVLPPPSALLWMQESFTPPPLPAVIELCPPPSPSFCLSSPSRTSEP